MHIRQQIENYIDQYAITKKKIYIIPTKLGIVFTGIMFAIFLIGLSYGNNLTLSVSFILFTYFVIQMLVTHKNISLIRPATISFTNDDSHKDIQCSINLEVMIFANNYVLELNNDVKIDLNSNQYSLSGPFQGIRGKYSDDKIKISNTAQAGLFYAWRFYSISYSFYIYPSPVCYRLPSSYRNQEAEQFNSNNEFSHYIPYIDGFPSKRLNWKIFAKTDQLYLKYFIGHNLLEIELNFYDLPGPAELRLSYLSYLIENIFKKKMKWSLVLPNEVINNCHGYTDYIRCKKILSEAKV